MSDLAEKANQIRAEYREAKANRHQAAVEAQRAAKQAAVNDERARHYAQFVRRVKRGLVVPPGGAQ